jgi:hypothetical protein
MGSAVSRRIGATVFYWAVAAARATQLLGRG